MPREGLESLDKKLFFLILCCYRRRMLKNEAKGSEKAHSKPNILLRLSLFCALRRFYVGDDNSFGRRFKSIADKDFRKMKHF